MNRLRDFALRLRGGVPHEYEICHDLAAWAAGRPGAERVVLDSAFTTTRPLPATIGDVDASFHPLCSVDVRERALVKIPAARIRGEMGLVILPDDEFVGELVAVTPAGQRSMLAAEAAFTDRLPSRAPHKRGNFYAVLGFGWNHYYHWSHDLIMGMRGVGAFLPGDTRLLVPEHLAPFQLETLALLELDELERVPFPRGACWELENLFVVTPRLKTQLDSAAPFEWFRERAMKRYNVAEAVPSRRLLLSRRFDNHWRTTNEAEVEEFLAPIGFETVMPAKLSFRDQIELFSRGELIVGTGAGLFNMVFAPRTAKILQFQEPLRLVHALWTQASALQMSYRYLMCESVANTESEIADLRVPIEGLRASLDAMGVH